MLLAAHKHLFHPCLITFAACLQASFLLEVFTFVGKIVVDTTHTLGRHFSYGFIVLDFAISGLSYGVDDQSLKDAFSGFGDVVDGKFSLLSLLSHGVQFQPPVSLTLPYVLQFPLMSL